MTFYNDLLRLPEFSHSPPVLVDVGAAGFVQPQWRPLARHSVYVGFDPDNREMEHVTCLRSKFRAFHVIPAVVGTTDGKTEFYFTQSPQCSSTLPPDGKALAAWSFQPLFDVVRTAKVPTIRLETALSELSIKAVDWFKTDSQGSDLSILKSLGPYRMERLIAAELEPGIEDAYRGEDKMHAIMAYMDAHPFWLSQLKVKGPQRIRIETLDRHFSRVDRRFLRHLLPTSAFYGEMTYLNTFTSLDMQTRRSLILGWIISTIKGQHGFALELAMLGNRLHGETPFTMLRDRSISLIRRNRAIVPFRLAAVAFQAIGRILFP